MSSQHDATISSDDEQIIAIAEGIYDAAQSSPTASLVALLDEYATQHGFSSDDRALLSAVEQAFRRHGSAARFYTTSLTFPTSLDGLRYEDAFSYAVAKALGRGESLACTYRRAGNNGETVYLTPDTPAAFLALPEAAGAVRREGVF